MDARPSTIADVFAGQKQYVVPVFMYVANLIR
jgi:hypothetical protein